MVMSAALGGASFFMTQADMIEALVVMFKPDFEPTVWQSYLIYLASVIVYVTATSLKFCIHSNPASTGVV